MNIKKSLLALCLSLCFGGFSAFGASAGLASDFARPPEDVGIRCFWWWLNSNVTKGSITRDLEEMKAKGFDGALIFDADGSGKRSHQRVPDGPVFGSPEWTELWVHAVKEADRLGLVLSLNIQSGWNLGGPSVEAEDATQHLVWSTLGVEGGQTVDVQLERPNTKEKFYRDIKVIAVPVVAGERIPIEKLELKNATRELGGSAPDTRFLLNSTAQKPGEAIVASAKILNLSEKMDADGRLVWKAPEGAWEIIRFGHGPTGAHVSTHTRGAGGRVLDYLRPEALEKYWEENVDPLMDAIGPLAGSTVKYIHTDSWEGGGMNWTPGFGEEFRQRRGYDLLPWMAVLAGHVVDSREASNAFLADFRKTVSDLVAKHYATLAGLADRYGMGTHPESAGPHAGSMDGLKNYGRSELMMSEFWSPSPHRPAPTHRFFSKQAASAAHIYGKQLVGAEGFTTIGPQWNDTPWSDMKHSVDHEFCSGLNLVYVHTFTASPEEMGMPGQEYFAGTHFNPQITWWDESHRFIDYMRRCQVLLQKGDFVADVVHYYGDHIPNIFSRKEVDPAGALPGFDYDVLNEELLVGAMEVVDGKLSLPSGMRYQVLSIPDHRVLSLAALEKIAHLVRMGGTVLGPKPLKAVSLVGGEAGKARFRELADELWGDFDTPQGIRQLGEGRVAWGMSAARLLEADGLRPDLAWTPLQTTGSKIDWTHRKIGQADVYFLAELSGKPGIQSFTFRQTGRIPEIWNPVDGSIREAGDYRIEDGATTLPLKFDAYDSLFIVFRQVADAPETDSGSNWTDWAPRQTIDGSWMVRFDPEWGGPAEPVRFDKLIDWTEHKMPGIRHYSGMASYRIEFEVDELQGDEAIELGELRGVGIARVKLNGVDLGSTWRPPFRVKAGHALREGANTLVVEAYNSWHNRVMADDQLPENERLTRTNINSKETTKRFEWKAELSGLIGPVRIVEPVAGEVN